MVAMLFVKINLAPPNFKLILPGLNNYIVVHRILYFITGKFSLDDAKNMLITVAHLWRRLGKKFEFSDAQLDAIMKDHPDDSPEEWMSIMLEQRAQKNLEWVEIVKALLSISQPDLAREIGNGMVTYSNPQ